MTRLNTVLLCIACVLLGWRGRGVRDGFAVDEEVDRRLTRCLAWGISSGLLSVNRDAADDRAGITPEGGNVKKEQCPKCGAAYDPKKDTVVECPRCGVEGSTKCCNPGGRNCPCVECEEGDTAE